MNQKQLIELAEKHGFKWSSIDHSDGEVTMLKRKRCGCRYLAIATDGTVNGEIEAEKEIRELARI